jgi:hypothetical protein
MRMERFIMLKMFIGALGASSASMALISRVAPEKFEKARAKARARARQGPVARARQGAVCSARSKEPGWRGHWVARARTTAPLTRAAAPRQVSGGKKRFSVAALGAGAAPARAQRTSQRRAYRTPETHTLTPRRAAGILGVGMAVGGACPGMVLAQLGSGVATSGFTLAGCLSVRPFPSCAHS